MNFQKHSDKLLEKTLLPFIPKRMTPNQVSWLRIFSLPFIFFLLLKEEYVLGLVIFVLAALTDALDGAMARTRNQVTETGKVLDAIADKGLILLVAFIFIPKIFGWAILLLILFPELLNVFFAYRSKKKIGVNPEANWIGKLKMVVQSVAFGAIFIGFFSGSPSWFSGALALLWISIVLAFLQLFFYPMRPVAVKTP